MTRQVLSRGSCCLLILALLLTFLPAANPSPAASRGLVSHHVSPPPASSDPAWEKMGSTLALMLAAKERKVELSPGTLLGRIQADIQAKGMVQVSVRFERELVPDEVAALERKLGLRFHRLDGKLCHVAAIYGISVPLEQMADFSRQPEVVQIELLNKPAAQPLDVSIPLVGADQVWATQDWVGRNIRGQGVRIADFDTSVDVYHPDFWYADGGTYDWFDNDGGGFTGGGGECVDLNGNSVCDFPGETLRYFDEGGAAGIGAGGVLEANIDWLYNDADNDGQRDYGPTAGYTETQPTYGERIFLVNDATNLNNALDAGEKLVALGTSKVYATLNCGTPPVTRTRGVDLYLTDADTNGHGTGVAGVALGGNIVNISGTHTVPNRRFVGVAPEAELLVSNTGCWPAIPETTYIPWAANNGADVMLYEFSAWIGEFLDGSSNLEQMMDAQAANGIIQVVPAGNLAGSNKEDTQTVSASGSHVFTAQMPALTLRSWAFMAFLWRNPSVNVTYTLTNPFGSSVTLPATSGNNWGLTSLGSDTIWYRRLDSSRGTAKYDIWIQASGAVASGNWLIRADNPSGTSQTVYAYVTDIAYQWSGGMVWVSPNETKTVCHPATADSAITIGSYATRAGFDTVPLGDLSSFSSRGSRVDGTRILDITAPGGQFEVVSAESKDSGTSAVGKYGWTGGTSAAGPHVAGTVALMLQKNPSLTPTQVVNILHTTAITDSWTEHASHGGPTPNDHWGWGKLNAAGAVSNTPAPTPDFSLVVTPTQRQVVAGQATTYAMGLSSSFGFTAPVTLSVGGLPAATFSSWSRNPITPGITSTLWVTTALATPPGDHVLGIKGTSSRLVHTASATLTVLAPALAIDKAVASSVLAGELLTYTITVSNTGNVAATSVVVTDAVPTGASYVGCGGGTCGESGGVVTWSGLTVPAGNTVDVTFVVTACTGPLANNAYRVVSCAEGVSSPWGASTTTTVQANPPTAGFTPSASVVCVGDVVAFTNTSANATSYQWSFGDGDGSTDEHPTHQYTSSGARTVILTATNACGFDVHTDTITVYDVPVAGFTPSAIAVGLGEVVTFTNTSLNATSYQWDFGDGVGASTAVHPTYTYASDGWYTITLVASNPGCSDSSTQQIHVTRYTLYLPLVLKNY